MGQCVTKAQRVVDTSSNGHLPAPKSDCDVTANKHHSQLVAATSALGKPACKTCSPESTACRCSFAVASGSKCFPESIESMLSVTLASSCLQDVESADSLPCYVASNPLWLQLVHKAKAVHLLMSTEERTVLLLVLQDAYQSAQVVLKGYSAAHAALCKEQVTAEISTAKRFSGHPLLATVLATCYDSDGNFCSISPYAGCSLYSLVTHPLWMDSTTLTDRLQFFRHVAVHCLTAHSTLQEQPNTACIYRDTKPENIAINQSSGQVTVIDFGLVISASKEDYFKAFTVGYFTPEIADAGSDYMHDNFFEYEKRKACTNTSMDVFLLSFVGLDMVLRIPAELQTCSYNLSSQDPNSGEGLLELLDAHSEADYTPLSNCLPDLEAKDFFTRTLCRDPEQRPTPAEALKLPWLADSVTAVQQCVSATQADYQQRNMLVLDLLAGVEGAFLAPPVSKQHKQSRC